MKVLGLKSNYNSIVTKRKIYKVLSFYLGMNAKNCLSIFSLLGILLFPKVVKGGLISGAIYDSWNNQTSDSTNVSCWINDGSSGTQTCKIPWWGIYGLYGFDSGNFNPPAQPSDTGHMSASLTVGSKTYVTHMRKGPLGVPSIFPTAFLDDPDKTVLAHAFGIWKVKDMSNVADTLKARGWLKKNSGQKIQFINYYLRSQGLDSTKVDTSDIYPQVYINLEKQDSLWQPTDSAVVELYKTKNDTTWFSDTTFALDTLKYGCATMVDSLTFAGESLYVFKDIGIEAILVPDSADSGDVIEPGVVVRNYGTINQNPWLHCKINEFYNDSTQVVAQPGIDTFYFAPCTLSQVGNWLVTSYSVLQGDVNSSNDTLQKTIVVNSVGVEERGLENKVNKFEIYPSVGRGMFNIKGYRGKVSIYDATGRKVAVSMIQDENSKLNLAYLSEGVYFVKPEDVALKPEDSNELIKKVLILK